MAKKKSRRSFNMSAAVRDVLTENPNLTAKEVEAEVKKQHPGQKINSNSLSVSFSSARKKLGITKGKKRTVKRRRPSARGRANGTVDMAALQAARKYVAEVGDVDAAMGDGSGAAVEDAAGWHVGCGIGAVNPDDGLAARVE